jgi:hypothetical protein
MAAITSQVMEGFGVMAAVVNAKSFVGAGEALGMTQSSGWKKLWGFDFSSGQLGQCDSPMKDDASTNRWCL